MKIVIDARIINESGIGRYLLNLLENLQKLDNKNEYFILHLTKDYDISMYQSNFHKILANFRWYTVAEQIKLPKILHDLRPDLVHFPHFNVPIFWHGKFVVTIHDLIHQHYSFGGSTTHGKLIFNVKKYGYKKVFESAVKKSSRVLVPSQFVKGQLVNEWQVNADKIVITQEAVDTKLITIVSTLVKGQEEKILKKFGIKSNYIFYVGNAHPHKNIEGLIRAFLKLKETHEDLKLVLSGKENYFWRQIKNKYSNPNIIYTGFVTDEELVWLYKNASVYVEPSFEEGFGLPLLEAFANGCPVVSSSAGSLEEVGGDAALYFDPAMPEGMADKISKVLESEKLRQKLIEKGKKRVKDFSWKKMAEQTLKVYNES